MRSIARAHVTKWSPSAWTCSVHLCRTQLAPSSTAGHPCVPRSLEGILDSHPLALGIVHWARSRSYLKSFSRSISTWAHNSFVNTACTHLNSLFLIFGGNMSIVFTSLAFLVWFYLGTVFFTKSPTTSNSVVRVKITAKDASAELIDCGRAVKGKGCACSLKIIRWS